MNTLVINAGSTTIKFTLLNQDYGVLLSGILDNVYGEYIVKLQKDGQEHEWTIDKQEFENAALLILKECSEFEIEKLGFRIVHGGENYYEPTLLTDHVIDELEKLNDLAPLHNPPAIMQIRAFRKLLPDAPLYGVFDTAFHNKMPEKAFLYAIPYEFYSEYKIRRFGFHGISHQYVSERLHELDPDVRKVLSCHLGGGASITAIQHGHSMDTSMGFTPLEGLMMATRPGDIDDGAIHYLMSKLHMSVKDMQNIENQYSGLLGVSGESSDMRKLLELEADGHERAKLAIEMYIYRIQKYIGAYSAALGGVDALIFTAGVGAGSDVIRKRVCENLDFLNLHVDDSINDGKYNVTEEIKISTPESASIWVIPTDEEKQIAMEIANL